MAGGGGNKKRYQYCTDSSGEILYLRALQGHSGRSLIDPTLQDNVVIPSDFFQYIYHVGCAINLHSIINSGLLPGGQNLRNRQTIFFLPVDPMNENHRDPATIDLSETRHAQYMHKTWKKRQNTVFWVDINLALRKEVLSNTIERNHSSRNTPSLLYSEKLFGWKLGEVIYEKVYASPRPPPKISLKHDWMKELGSEVARRPDGQVVQQSKSSLSNLPHPNPDHDRTGTPVVCRDASHAQGASQTRSSHESTNFNIEDETNHDRTGTLVVCRDASHAQGHEQ